MLVRTSSTLIDRRGAQVGRAGASEQALVPIARRSVLLPDMLVGDEQGLRGWARGASRRRRRW